MSMTKLLYLVALIFLIIGGINWGLVGAFNFDLVASLFGPLSALSKLVYLLVGLSAIYVAIATIIAHNRNDLVG
jgi:uncharacterized protein